VASSPDSRRLGYAARGETDRGGPHACPFVHARTERPIPRPKDPEDQQADDRGQQKGHTLNNRLVIHETCRVCFWSHTCAGQASDQSLAALAGSTLPPGSCLDQDQGVQGVVLPGITLFQGKKTPRGGEFTPPEQATTRRLASSSIRMEHANGGVKRERMVKRQHPSLEGWPS
jgi:DDE superfamily endonuclease